MAESADGTNTLAQQSSVSFLGNVSERVLSFLFLIVVTHLVAPSIYGLFTLGVTIVTFSKGIASLRLNRALDYFIPMYVADGEHGKARATLSSATRIGLLSAAIGTVLLIGSADLLGGFFGKPELAAVLPLLSVALLAGTANDLLFGVFNSVKRLEYRTLTKGLIRPGTKLVVTAVLIWAGFELVGLVVGYVVSFVLTAIAGVLLLTRIDWIRDGEQASVSNRRLVSYSLPLAFAGVIYATIGQVDFLVIGFYLPSDQLGFYRVGFLFASNVLIIISSMKPIFKPMVAEATGQRNLVLNRYKLATRWITLFTLPISITVALVPDVYLELFFSSAYLPAATAVAILVVGYLVNASFGLEGMVLEGLGYTRLTLLNTVLILGTNLVLDFLLVPRLGIVGAAIGTAAGITVGGLAGLVELYYLRGLHPASVSLGKIWIAGLTGGLAGYGVVTFLSAPGLLLAVLVPTTVCITYYGGLLVAGAFTEDDEDIARAVDAKIGRAVLSRLLRSHS